MKCKITTISPIHIAGGENKVISPYSDYVYDNGFVFLIDNNKLFEYLKGRKDFNIVFEKYLRQIKTNINKKYGKNLGDFFSNTLKEDYKKFSYKKIFCVSSPKNQKIDLFQKTNGKPFIPGSTLKGAIRTAILFDYFNSRKKELNIHNKYWENDKLGKGKDDIMKFLRITDTEPIEQQTEIAYCERINVNSKKQSIPQNYEIISKDVKANLEIISNAEKKHDSIYQNLRIFNFLYKGNEQQFFSIINNFSEQNIEFELNTFRKYNKNGFFNEIVEFYQNLLDEQKSELGTTAILRIGKGKTFFDNSISGLFKDDDYKMKKIKTLPKRKIGFSQKGNKFVEPFPITRTLIMKDEKPYLPLGWIRISKI